MGMRQDHREHKEMGMRQDHREHKELCSIHEVTECKALTFMVVAVGDHRQTLQWHSSRYHLNPAAWRPQPRSERMRARHKEEDG